MKKFFLAAFAMVAVVCLSGCVMNTASPMATPRAGANVPDISAPYAGPDGKTFLVTKVADLGNAFTITQEGNETLLNLTIEPLDEKAGRYLFQLQPPDKSLNLIALGEIKEQEVRVYEFQPEAAELLGKYGLEMNDSGVVTRPASLTGKMRDFFLACFDSRYSTRFITLQDPR